MEYRIPTLSLPGYHRPVRPAPLPFLSGHRSPTCTSRASPAACAVQAVWDRSEVWRHPLTTHPACAIRISKLEAAER